MNKSECGGSYIVSLMPTCGTASRQTTHMTEIGGLFSMRFIKLVYTALYIFAIQCKLPRGTLDVKRLVQYLINEYTTRQLYSVFIILEYSLSLSQSVLGRIYVSDVTHQIVYCTGWMYGKSNQSTKSPVNRVSVYPVSGTLVHGTYLHSDHGILR